MLPISSKPLSRRFFGIELPEAARQAAASARPGARLRGLRLTPLEKLHVTLRFLGEVEDAVLDPVREDLRRTGIGAFTLPLEGAGRFPARGAVRVLWLGVGKGHPRLFQLRQAVDDSLLRHGAPCELRDFVPHITLARVERGGEGAAASALKRLEAWQGPVVKVSAFALFESRSGENGSEYTICERFLLE